MTFQGQESWTKHDGCIGFLAKAMTYNILVSRPLKYVRARGYYLLFIIVYGTSLLPRDTVAHTERNMIMEDGLA